jgi:hypothetical protein
LRQIRHHQLRFAGMHRRGTRVPGRPPGNQGRRASQPRPSPPRPVTGWIQLRLFDASRDDTRSGRRRHADFTSPWLARARAAARAIGEARGWSRPVASGVDRGLVIVLSGHADGDQIRYSELFPALRAGGITVERTVEVLAEIGVFHDDRVPAFETWPDRSLAGPAPASGPTPGTGSGPCGTAAPGPVPAPPRPSGPTCARPPRRWRPGPAATAICGR